MRCLARIVCSSLLLGACTQSPPPASAPAPSASPVDEELMRQCTDLVQIINRTSTAIEQVGDAGADPSSRDLITIAGALNRASDDISRLVVTIPIVRQRSVEYADWAKRSATAAQSLAAALDAGDSVRIETATASFEAAEDSEERLIAAVNALCQSP